MTSPCSSGSSRVDSALDPTMSQNMIVSWRRSAEDAVEGVGAVLRVVVDDAGATFPVATCVPHLLQKPFSAGTAFPQFEHVRGKAMPHLPQKLLPSGASALHPGHCKGARTSSHSSVSKGAYRICGTLGSSTRVVVSPIEGRACAKVNAGGTVGSWHRAESWPKCRAAAPKLRE